MLQEITNSQISSLSVDIESEESFAFSEITTDEPTESPADVSTFSQGSSLNLPSVDTGSMILDEPLSKISETSDASEEKEKKEENSDELLINMGTLLYNVYESLLEREVKRRLLPPRERYVLWENLGEIAIHMDGHKDNLRRKKLLEYLEQKEDRIHYLLSLGIFRYQRRGDGLALTQN
ncbi:MAG: hypothetical protein ACP5HM_16255 [Anaerolineae bacterium]